MPSDRSIEVGPNHKRGIEATLTHLDEAICEFDQWAAGREMGSVLFHERNGLSSEQRAGLCAESAAIRSVLEEIRAALDLAPRGKDVAGAISARCMLSWEYLIELQGRYLSRYGETSPELSAFLDPKVDELVKHMENIVRLLGVIELHQRRNS